MLSQQAALAQLAGTLKDLRHLGKFIAGVVKWLESPGVAGCVRPKELNYLWVETVNNGKAKKLGDRARRKLVAEIKAFIFVPEATEHEL